MAIKKPHNRQFAIFKMSAGILLRAIIVCFVSGCDMFSPRSVEKPQGVFVDRLHLSEIMNHTGQQFSKSTYEDILHPDFIFKAYNDKPFSQTEEITRLKSIIVDQTVHAFWDTCPGNYQDPPDTIIVCRKFTVAYHKTASDSGVDSGETQLRLEYYSPKNTWTIRSWTEIGALSIFNPDFK